MIIMKVFSKIKNIFPIFGFTIRGGMSYRHPEFVLGSKKIPKQVRDDKGYYVLFYELLRHFIPRNDK